MLPSPRASKTDPITTLYPMAAYRSLGVVWKCSLSGSTHRVNRLVNWARLVELHAQYSCTYIGRQHVVYHLVFRPFDVHLEQGDLLVSEPFHEIAERYAVSLEVFLGPLYVDNGMRYMTFVPGSIEPHPLRRRPQAEGDGMKVVNTRCRTGHVLLRAGRWID